MKSILTATAALALMAGGALAQNAMMDFDADMDGLTSSEEFGTGLSGAGVFASYDANEDGLLSADEYGDEAEAFAGYDADASGDLTEEEFAQGIFGEYDSDADGAFSTEETETFNAEFESEGRFEGRMLDMGDDA